MQWKASPPILFITYTNRAQAWLSLQLVLNPTATELNWGTWELFIQIAKARNVKMRHITDEMIMEATGGVVLRKLSRYMIALAGLFQPKHHDGINSGSPNFFCFPGFVLAIGEKRVFVTAGHNLREIKRIYGEKYVEWTGMAWVEFASDFKVQDRVLSVDNSIPRHYDFECDFIERTECDKASGTQDWGTMELTATEWNWMESRGVQSIGLNQMKTTFDSEGYILVGLPTELFDRMKIDDGGTTAGVEPIFIRLLKRDDLIQQSGDLWFVGDLSNAEPLNIHGMSGGPMFAINSTNSLSVKIWVAGVQSHWCPQSRIAFVCPAKTILDHLPEHLRQ